jgi:hypothetical protein
MNGRKIKGERVGLTFNFECCWFYEMNPAILTHLLGRVGMSHSSRCKEIRNAEDVPKAGGCSDI